MGKSAICELGGKLFRYDFNKSVVEYVCKATEEEKRKEAEWLRDHDRPLYGIDSDGYMTLDSVGLSLKNWKHKMDSYLFVGDHLEEWDMDRKAAQNPGDGVFAYVYNHDNPDYSELGDIGVARTSAAGLKRIW